ncbi:MULTISPECIES: YceI family protein [Streptomyces]|uniref:Polyisoprenoid-binding protein n=1 Tax=Streptomyces dengpaensis TaxID=2049881 RepID=A0ABM6T1W2_9ACTN|nr:MULTISPECIES: YceI family protein [Streptomyces]AVH60643.1 polyisoprenoid-binding protein [Streptomyces dengpaensis]PIB03553.1 polyisoprenoid-binding protein [Streptomyces sp. HG99]
MLKNRKHNNVSGIRPHRALTGVYTIDPVHSLVGFSVRHAMVSNVWGRFDAFEGLLKLDGTRPTRSKAYVSVQTGSLATGIQDRDAHLTGPDFFDSLTFPLMTFRSTLLVPVGDEDFRLWGRLRIKDVELPISIDLAIGGTGRDSNGKSRIGFEGTATLQRSDWGLNWNTMLEAGGVLVSDKVKLIFDISAVQLAQSAAA